MSEQPTSGTNNKDTAVTEPPAMVGDGWVNCAQGHGHWGRFGAAGLLPVHRDAGGEAHVLLHHRATDTDQGGTWSLLGGARDSHESPARAAVREATEESTLDPAGLRVERVVRDDHGGWSYDTVIVSADRRSPVQPVEGESLALAWVPLSEVPSLDLHPSFAASWPRVRTALGAVLDGEPASVPTPSVGASALPPHPTTGAPVIARQPLDHHEGVTKRELASFADGTRAVYEEHARPEDATEKVLDAHVGRAVGARVPLSHPVGPGAVYTDHMPGEPASAEHRSLAELADRGAATRDGVFLGMHYALTAQHGAGVDQLALGPEQSLLVVDGGTVARGALPDAANPFVRTFFRETEPHVFSWVDNPVPPGDIEIMRRHLDGLRPLFENAQRADLHDTVMERFGQVAEHAIGTAPLLPRAPGAPVELPAPRPEQHHPLPPPLDSPERREHQRIGEELLTDGGRVTETPQAKTIAIRALAERMDSSTPELVLAAMGLGVGNDMVERLGDDDYVLVPYNEQYPSMGADVLRVDELDAADPRHAPDRVVPMGSPGADELVRTIAVSELMSAWSYGSNNNTRVLALQEATKEEFGLTEVLEWHMDPKVEFAVNLELAYNRDVLREFLRTQYEMTQEVLAARGVTEVISYRGLTWSEGAAQPEWAGLEVGDSFEARQRPLASWSADRQIVADWLEQRGGHGVILVDRKPAEDVLSLPVTGMGYLGQKEWVTLPGDSLVTLDGVYADGPRSSPAEQTAASSVSLGAPALGGAAQEPGPEAAPAAQEADGRWQPLAITESLDPADPLDRQIMNVLAGAEAAPEWWPKDDTGYAITQRDLDFLGINPVQVKWMLTGEAPMGMTPALYQQFGTEMLAALGRDGIDPSELDIRLKGTGAGFYSGIHKTLPREDDLIGRPEAVGRLQEWFGDSQERPLRRPYDAMWRLGLDPEPSDFDLDINSTAIVRQAREQWRTNQPHRYAGDFMGGHGYLDKQAVAEAVPALAEWAGRWEAKLGRPLSLGVFESSGPFDATVLGRSLSSHFKETDWIIHRPDTPMGSQTPRSRIPDPLRSPEQAARSGTVPPSPGSSLAQAARRRSAAGSPSGRNPAAGNPQPLPPRRHGPEKGPGQEPRR
ncbi:NUDIX domain-containing protein [Streptomyces sp. NPDC058171]